jgi:predicted small metal-binding protein
VIPMSKTLRCPCGTVINADDEDELVTLTQEHLAAEHPGREYTRDEILFMAAW